MKKMLQNFGSILSTIFLIFYLKIASEFGRISQLFGRIHRAQSVTLLRIAYCIDVVEQCCQMAQYKTFFYKMV